MHLSYQRLVQDPNTFKRIRGVSQKEFEAIAHQVRPSFEVLEAKKLSHGRNSHLATLEDKLLCLLIYYRTYITHMFLGYLFNLDDSNICLAIKKIEPLLAKKITITKDRSLTPDKVLELLADVSEQARQRPVKRQKRSYSGKKKRHTIKTEIVMQSDGKIVSVSKSDKGRTMISKSVKTRTFYR
jgi:hypothetical protein